MAVALMSLKGKDIHFHARRLLPRSSGTHEHFSGRNHKQVSVFPLQWETGGLGRARLLRLCVCLLVLPDFLLPQDPLDFPVNVNKSYLSGRLRIHCFVCFLHFSIFKTQNSTIIIK